MSVEPRRLQLDIFCRVIDNYGDAGVCLRLARQLNAREHSVRLIIDDLAVLGMLAPNLQVSSDFASATGTKTGIQIVPWKAGLDIRPPASGVLIEAFGCDPPDTYIARLAARNHLWLNLEYLSAEDWIDQHHACPSLRSDGLQKFFFFPGFTAATGGLLPADGWLSKEKRHGQEKWQKLVDLTGVSPRTRESRRLMMLFAYPDAPFDGLFKGLQASDERWLILVPPSISVPEPGFPQIQIRPIPFVDQESFDVLLTCSDLNLVRGEDSLVRAIWARAPFLWQAYRQETGTRLRKVAALLDRACLPGPAHELQLAWNRADNATVARLLPLALKDPAWQSWQSRCRAWARELAAMPDLLERLEDFCQLRLALAEP